MISAAGEKKEKGQSESAARTTFAAIATTTVTTTITISALFSCYLLLIIPFEVGDLPKASELALEVTLDLRHREERLTTKY